MKSYKLYLTNFFTYLRTQVKPLGYVENVVPFLSQKKVYEIECLVFESLKDEAVDSWNEIFKRNKQLFLIDKLILKSARKLSVLWLFRFMVIHLLRFIYIAVDILQMLLFTPPTYHLGVNISGNKASKKTIIAYTNNRSRSKIFNIDGHYCLYDFLVSHFVRDGYQSRASCKLSFKVRAECLKLKLRFPYIHSDDIFQVVASKILFAKGFDELLNVREDAGVFSREGVTHVAKIFLYTAGRAGFLRNVIYTLPAITPNVLFPRECENLVLISDCLPCYLHSDTNVIVLRDNPYLQWRDVAVLPPIKKSIGLLLGDDMNRWVEQEITDRIILDKLKFLGCSLCLGRPHPQELTRPHRVKYYKRLIEEYAFLKLELGEPEKFLTDISTLIVYTKSTMVQEALLCNRAVVEYRVEHGHSPNESFLNLSNNLGVSISDIDFLGREIDEMSSKSISQRNLIWEGLLKNLNLSVASKVDVAAIFDRHLIR